MKSDIEIVEKEIGDVLEIEERVPVWKMPKVMSTDFTRLFSYAEKEGANPTEAYARYQGIDWDAELAKGALANFIGMFTKKWHFFVGVPISRKLENGEGMVSSFLQKRRFVQSVHKGPYRKVGKTYERMMAWMNTQGLKAQNECIEFYRNDPREVKEEEIETLVLIPIE